MSGTLHRRLSALEEIAARCRVREARETLRAIIVRDASESGIALAPADVEARAERALVVAERMASLAAGGLTLEQIARRIAVEHDQDPNRVLAIFHELRAQRGH